MKIFHGTAAIFHFLLILATCNHSVIADGLRKRQDFTFANSTVANTTRSGRNLYCAKATTHTTTFWYQNTGAYTVRQVRFSSKHCNGREGSYDEHNHYADLNADDGAVWSKTVATDVWDYSNCEGGKQYWDICVKIWIKHGDKKKRCFKHYAYEGNCYNSPNNICLHSGGTTNVNNSPKTYSSGSAMTYILKEENDFTFYQEGGPDLSYSSSKYKVACSGFGVNCEFDAKGNSFKEKYCYDMGMNTCAKGVASNNICCASSCGTCGGSGCGGRDGGTSKCCAGTITNSGKYCEHADDTACIISDYLDFTPCSDGIKSGYACCASSCGSCGGSGCADLEGGANHCCDDTILESDHYCGHTGDVGCIIPANLR